MNIQEFKNYLKEKNKKHVIFDFDETLAKLLIDWSNWQQDMKNIFSSCGIDFESMKFKHNNYSEAQNQCVRKFGDKVKQKILEECYKNEKEYYQGYDLFPTTLPLLEASKDLVKIYLWTSNDEKTILPILRELEIIEFFEKIITHNDVRFIKPDPEGFFLISDGKSLKEEYLFIGDSASDIGAGENAEIDFINIAEIKL